MEAGRRVALQGLEKRPELNGCAGRLVAFDAEAERWELQLDRGGAPIKVKEANLMDEVIVPFPWESLATDVQLQVLRNLPGRDLSAFRTADARGQKLATELQKAAPQVVVTRGAPRVALDEAVNSLRGPPTFAFGITHPRMQKQWTDGWNPPPGCAVAGAAAAPQTNIDGDVSSDEKQLSLMMGFFPKATARAIALADNGTIGRFLADPGSFLPEDTKVLIFLACGGQGEVIESALRAVYSHRPAVAVLGGICQASWARTAEGGFAHVRMGVVGLAVGGDCPIKAFVSRGVEPLLPYTYIVKEVQPAEDPEDGEVMVTKVQREAPGTAAQERVMTGEELVDEVIAQARNAGGPPYIGLQSKDGSGFLLDQLHNGSFTRTDEGLGLLVSAKEDDAIRFYKFSVPACKRDLAHQLATLRGELADVGKDFMGCMLFSCGARGPGDETFGEAMMDATCCEAAFPGLPLLGFYAGGEVGPQAAADVEEGVLREPSRPALQGFTAVFAAFVVPDVDSAIANLALTI